MAKKYRLILVDEAGNTVEFDPAIEGSQTIQQLLDLFGEAVVLQRRKALTYGDAYRSQGYMGNLARVLSKASRLKNMVWRDQPIEDGEESVMDTAVDLINLTGFFIINYRDRNKWGI